MEKTVHIKSTPAYLEKCILFVFSIFIIFAPYIKKVSKVCFCWAFLFTLIISIYKYKKRFIRAWIIPNPLNRYLFLFLTMALAATLLSGDIRHSQEVFFERYVYYILYFFLAHAAVCCWGDAVRKDRSAGCRNLYVIISVILIAAFIYGLGGVRDLILRRSVRLFTVWGHTAPFRMIAMQLILYLPLSFFILLTAKSKFLRIMSALSLLVLVPCWIWHASRSGWIAVVAAISLFLFKKNKWFAICLILILIMGFSFLSQYHQRRVTSIVDPDRWGHRVELVKIGIHIFRDHPLFGAGPGMYEKLFEKYKPEGEEYAGFTRLHAHNGYVEVLSEMGIAGLICFLLIFVAFFRRAFRVHACDSSDEAAIMTGLLSVTCATLILLFFNSVITVGSYGAPQFWFIFGVANGLVTLLEHSGIEPLPHKPLSPDTNG